MTESPSFDEMYRAATPPWDTGRPQSTVVRLVADRAFVGRVLDVGCGTGENALYLADHGVDVTGVDSAPAAIAAAQAKAKARGVAVTFAEHDAFALDALKDRFDAALDSAVFHIFSDTDRPRYARSVAAALKPGGVLFVIAFADDEDTSWGGPRRVSRDDMRVAFDPWFDVERFERARYDTNLDIEGKAWLGRFIKR